MRPVVVAAMVVVLSACGGGAREPEGPVSYGDGDSGSTTTTTAAASAPTATAPPSTAPAGDRDQRPTVTAGTAPPSPTTLRVANRTERDDPSGFRLALVVADKVEFSSTEDVVMELTFTNTTDRTLYIHSDQRLFFGWATEDGQQRWTNEMSACVDAPPPPTRIAIPVEPGDGNRFVRRYPGEAGSARRERCRVAPGKYVVHGFLEWCPAATAANRSCDSPTAERIDAAPLTITIL